MKIHYISPYRTDKNIGKAINDAVRQLNAEVGDWVCLTDHDMMFLLPDTKAHIEEILSVTPYQVLGCKTNRVGVPEQLVGGCFSDITDIRPHISLARDVWEFGRASIKTTDGPVGAFMMCFRVGVWEFLGGFDEGVLNFDVLFCHKVRKSGGMIGIMQGVYVWHSYRIESTNPRQDHKHLL